MTRTIEQIFADDQIEVSARLIRTPELTIAVGDSWMLSQYHWPQVYASYVDGPSAIAVTMLIASVWILASPIPPDMPWLVPVGFAVAVGATWSIGQWVLNRFRFRATPPQPSRGVTYAVGEAAITIFQSDDEQEVQLVRRKLEQTLLQNVTNGD